MLETVDLVKTFGGVVATNRCSLKVGRGTITALIGPNGSGKTSLFNQICGLIRPDAGRIILDGRDITGLTPHRISRDGVARTFQITRVFPSLTVLENMIVAFHGETAVQRRAMELLHFVGLDDKAGDPAGSLSYGQRKLLEFARAHLNRPKIVLLDEPFAGVNPKLEEKMVEHIRAMNREGVTFFVIDHEMKIIMALCHPIVVLDYGEVIAQGSAAEIQNDERVIEAYFGR